MTHSNLGIEPEILKAIYCQMARIRAVDKAIQAGLSAGKFTFSYWPMTGQECIPATVAQLTTSRDYMVTTYRGVHDQIGKGVALEGLFAEMLGRTTGLNKGKGGAPHISDPASGSMVTTAIVGGGAPIANGLAFAAQSRGEDRVTIVNFGDGATSIGAVHEAMNLAGVWKLPIIFLCQNNTIGEYTPVADYTASKDFASRADALGFRGIVLDGNDPVCVLQRHEGGCRRCPQGPWPCLRRSPNISHRAACGCRRQSAAFQGRGRARQGTLARTRAPARC